MRTAGEQLVALEFDLVEARAHAERLEIRLHPRTRRRAGARAAFRERDRARPQRDDAAGRGVAGDERRLAIPGEQPLRREPRVRTGASRDRERRDCRTDDEKQHKHTWEVTHAPSTTRSIKASLDPLPHGCPA